VDTSSLSLVNGGTASFSGTLTEILQDQSWSRTLDFASLHAYQSQIHPTAQFAEDDLYISVLPAGNAFGFYDAAPDLVEMLFYDFPIGQESFAFIYGAFEDRSDISTTPYLSWDPPAEGTATHYWLRIRELFVDMDRTRSRPVASVFTADTQLLLPPDILEPGKSYFFQLISVNDPGRDILLRAGRESSLQRPTALFGRGRDSSV
jgi:hypothetical protein